MLEYGGRLFGQRHRIPVADNRSRRLQKGVDGRGRVPRAVFHVVDRHADQLARLRSRRSEPDVGERDAIGRRGGAFQRFPVLVKPLNQPVD